MPPLNFRQPGGSREVKAITAAYTVTDQDYGKIITNRGAGASVTVTMPAPATAEGESILFYTIAAQNFIVKAAAANQFVVSNDASASSVSIQTANQLIGNAVELVSDGTSWLVIPKPGTSLATNTNFLKGGNFTNA